MKKYFPLSLLIAGLVLLAVSCAPETVEVPVEVTREVQVEVTRVVEVPAEAEEAEEAEEPMGTADVGAVPSAIYASWAVSGHSDVEARAFLYFEEDGEVGIACAKCHSSYGYQDFLGADGSEVGVVDAAAPTGSVVDCAVCHNQAALVLDSVVMPSGVELTGLGAEARCMTCHQGSESGLSVAEAVLDLPEDEITLTEPESEDEKPKNVLGFINIHYFAATATKYGTLTNGGYEYEDKGYDAFFLHTEGFETCLDCHDPHSLEVKVESCTMCHEGVETVEDLKNVRMVSSIGDYDGDGDAEEGIYYEIDGLKAKLYEAMQSYASDVAGQGIVYDSLSYPYFFNDTNNNGQADEAELAYPNQYAFFTPRLLKAAYNYQVASKDPGGFAHGGKYIIQLLYDSIMDLDQGVEVGVRDDAGHFNGAKDAFRHWDEDDPAVVEADCAKCHSAGGLPAFLETDEAGEQQISSGFLCSTCHDHEDWPARFEVTSVTFPSGAVVEGTGDTMLCINCHQGRSSTPTVNEAVAEFGDDDVAVDEEGGALLRFQNIHYFAAGATLYGSEVQGAYQYDGNTYQGKTSHPVADCASCHEVHALEVMTESCTMCHTDVEDVGTINMGQVDYDGDGEVEGVKAEIEGVTEQLFAAIQAYAVATEGVDAIIYDGISYPYFFIDSDANGAVDPGEAIYPNAYKTWTPRLMKAAYNYQYAKKDPGAFTHNPKYVLQALYDSIEDLGGDVSALTRP
jgi:hypothetical protein